MRSMGLFAWELIGHLPALISVSTHLTPAPGKCLIL